MFATSPHAPCRSRCALKGQTAVSRAMAGQQTFERRGRGKFIVNPGKIRRPVFNVICRRKPIQSAAAIIRLEGKMNCSSAMIRMGWIFSNHAGGLASRPERECAMPSRTTQPSFEHEALREAAPFATIPMARSIAKCRSDRICASMPCAGATHGRTVSSATKSHFALAPGTFERRCHIGGAWLERHPRMLTELNVMRDVVIRRKCLHQVLAPSASHYASRSRFTFTFFTSRSTLSRYVLMAAPSPPPPS